MKASGSRNASTGKRGKAIAAARKKGTVINKGFFKKLDKKKGSR